MKGAGEDNRLGMALGNALPLPSQYQKSLPRLRKLYQLLLLRNSMKDVLVYTKGDWDYWSLRSNSPDIIHYTTHQCTENTRRSGVF